MAIANVVRTSFGPIGLDKMFVDELGVCLRALLYNPPTFRPKISVFLRNRGR